MIKIIDLFKKESHTHVEKLSKRVGEFDRIICIKGKEAICILDYSEDGIRATELTADVIVQRTGMTREEYEK